MSHYELEPLAYAFDSLEPIMSREQLLLHYEKHHKKYVDNANSILDKLMELRKEDKEAEFSQILKSLSFNIGGHVLHTIFWRTLSPAGNGGEPQGAFLDALNQEFGSLERFKKEFSLVGEKVEGSGWVALAYCKMTKRLMLMSIEKHNLNIYPTFAILLPLDVWEHAYYLDYKNERAKFIENYWQIVNWNVVNKNFENLTK